MRWCHWGWPCSLSPARARHWLFLQASAERYHVEPHPYFGYYGPPMPHHGYEDWSQIRYPPPPMAMEHPPPLPNSHLYHMVSLCPSLTPGPTQGHFPEGRVKRGCQRLHSGPLPNGIVLRGWMSRARLWPAIPGAGLSSPEPLMKDRKV